MPSLSSSLFAGLAFRGFVPPWLALLLGLLAVAGTFALYLFEAGRLPVLVRLILASIRSFTLCVILFLALNPVFTYQRVEEKKRSIAVLIDDSQSMLSSDPRTSFAERWRVAVAYDLMAPDGGPPVNATMDSLPEDLPAKPSRRDLVQKLFENPRLKLLEKWGQAGPVAPSTFGIRRYSQEAKSRDWLADLKAQEPKTALADSAFDLLRRGESEYPAAIIIVTDGRDNSSARGFSDLAGECKRRDVPLHIIGIGGSTIQQLQLREATVPDTLFVDDTVSIPVRYRVQGAGGGKVTISTSLNGVKVASKSFDSIDGDNQRDVLQFVPSREQAEMAKGGKLEFTTTITVQAGADTLTDKIARSVRVIDQKIKVLVVEGSPRWDFKFLQRSLMRDRRVEAKFFLFDGDPRAMKSGHPFIAAFPATRPELFKYDLLILGDVSANLLGREQQEMIRDFVAEGGGFLHIAGRSRGPASFVGTPIADVLPVEIDAVKFGLDTAARPAPFRPQLTPAGIRSPMLSLDDDPIENLRIWPRLQEMYWHYPVKKLKPGAEAYLAHPREKMADGKPMPLLASHYYGKGFSTFIAFDESWRWRYNEADRFFGRFWSQTVYVAGIPRTVGTKLTQLSLDTPDPLKGRTGTLYARLMTPELRPVTAAKIAARLEWLDAPAGEPNRVEIVDLQSLPGAPGDYIVPLPFTRLGRFALKVDNAGDAATLEYRVTLPPEDEMAPGGLAEAELRKLAEESGGKFYQEETAYKLAGDLKAKTITETHPESIDPLTNYWNVVTLLFIIGLFAMEWVARKFWSMS